MKRTTMPGFTAQTSLSIPGGSHRTSVPPDYFGGRRSVVPQISVTQGSMGGQGLNAWGCWQSECCTTAYHYVCNPFCHWSCNAEPCTRCIWPY